MARPTKNRRISEMPSVTHFVPFGTDENSVEENVLKMEELEALRLKDFDGYDQETCAVQMNVSRPTFQRILSIAREKVADSLLHGKAIRFEGGDYVQARGNHFCRRCGRRWDEPGEKEQAIEIPASTDEMCRQCEKPDSSENASQEGPMNMGYGRGQMRGGGRGRMRNRQD